MLLPGPSSTALEKFKGTGYGCTDFGKFCERSTYEFSFESRVLLSCDDATEDEGVGLATTTSTTEEDGKFVSVEKF